MRILKHKVKVQSHRVGVSLSVSCAVVARKSGVKCRRTFKFDTQFASVTLGTKWGQGYWINIWYTWQLHWLS